MIFLAKGSKEGVAEDNFVIDGADGATPTDNNKNKFAIHDDR
jgi:hypothetical protein